MMVPLKDLRTAFEGSPETQRKAAYRWCLGLPPSQRARLGDEWHVFSEAHLEKIGLTAGGFIAGKAPLALTTLAGFQLPPSAAAWDEADRQRFLNTHELKRRFDAFCRLHPHKPKHKIARLFAASGDGAWMRQHGLGTSWRALQIALGRIDPRGETFDGNVDRRGRGVRAAGDGRETVTPAAWELFKAIFLNQNKVSLAEAYRLVAGVAEKSGWAWPSLSTIRQRCDDPELLPVPVQTLARRGPRRFEADCVPKLARPYTDIAAGAHWVGDERTLDVICRVPDAAKGWRLIRPKLTAWLDLRSRMFVGWVIAEHANSDTILGALKIAAVQWGLPTEVTIDNGRDYQAVGGKRKRCNKWAEWDERRIGGVFEQTGVTVHYAIPFSPWSKPIEPHFKPIKEGFDKFFLTFCGGRLDEKPERLNKLVKDIEAVPTLEEVTARFATDFLPVHHATPQAGDGMFNRSPLAVMEQERGAVRTCDAAVLDLLCCRLAGPVKVGRDGVRYKGVLYGRFDETLFKHQGREVLLRIDPARSDFVTVCDQSGAPLCQAFNSALSAAQTTNDDLREAHRQKARLRRAAREYLPKADFLRADTVRQVLAVKRERVLAEDAARRAALPALPRPTITLVRPDLADAVRRLDPPDAPSSPPSTADDLRALAEELLALSDPRRTGAEEYVNPADLLGQFGDYEIPLFEAEEEPEEEIEEPVLFEAIGMEEGASSPIDLLADPDAEDGA